MKFERQEPAMMTRLWLRTVRPLVRAAHSRELEAVAARQKVGRINERPVEYAFAFMALNNAQPSRVLDVGTGRSAFPALLRTCGFAVTASDNVRDYWRDGLFNQHWSVVDDDIVASRLPAEQFDAVTCISVLEHIRQPLAAIEGMHRLLRDGGTLVLTTPFGMQSHENVYTRPDSYGSGNLYPCRQSSAADMTRWLQMGFELRSSEYWQFFEGSEYWSCGPLLRPPRRCDAPVHLGCFALEKRGKRK